MTRRRGVVFHPWPRTRCRRRRQHPLMLLLIRRTSKQPESVANDHGTSGVEAHRLIILLDKNFQKSKTKMSRFEKVAIPGKETIRMSLQCCADPLKAIEDFQSENGIVLPSIELALPLLDRNGLSRVDFYSDSMKQVGDALLKQIELLDKQRGDDKDQRLLTLLHRSFNLRHEPAIRPIVLMVLKNMNCIGQDYLNHLAVDKSLYDEVDIKVKRQLWLKDEPLFLQEVGCLFIQYLQQNDKLLFDVSEPVAHQLLALSPDQRQKSDALQKLATMVGPNTELYDTVQGYIKESFLATTDVAFCTLRSELLMAMRTSKSRMIAIQDSCYEFTLCLYAGIRDNDIDKERASKLTSMLADKNNTQLLGDLSLALCDPYAIHVLATSALKVMESLIGEEKVPKESPVLPMLLRLLATGLHSWDMCINGVLKESEWDNVGLLTKFIPVLMSLMVDDENRAIDAKWTEVNSESSTEHCGPLHPTFQAFIQKNRVASVLAMYYTLQIASKKDRSGLMRVLGSLIHCEKNRALEDNFLNSLFFHLVSYENEFRTEDFCIAIFDNFFFIGLTKKNISRHISRLVTYVEPKLHPNRRHVLRKILGWPTCTEDEESMKPICIDNTAEVTSPCCACPIK